MRLHADHLTYLDLVAAAQHAHVYLATSARHGSRKRDHAFEVKLEGSSTRRPNYGTRGGSYGSDAFAATWDEWGDFLGYLFRQDETLTIPAAYSDAEDFHHRTGDRFNGSPYRKHAQHRWEFATVGEFHCRGSKAHGECDAVLRHPMGQRQSSAA